MASPFYEIFREFETDAESKNILGSAAVEKVSTNSTKDKMRIYLRFETLIPKRRIWKFEDEIKRQFFSQKDVDVRIVERFSLSELYDAKTLYEAYRDSILEEIYRTDSVLYGVFKKADFSFDDDNKLRVTLEDTVIAHEKANTIETLLKQIFTIRCGQELEVSFSYKKAEKSKYSIQREKMIESLTSDISRIAATTVPAEDVGGEMMTVDGDGAQDANGGTGDNVNGGANGSTGRVGGNVNGTAGGNRNGAGGRQTGNGGNFGSRNGQSGNGWSGRNGKTGGKRYGYRPMKRSSDPNVLYGGDVEEAYIPIADIYDDIGSVTVRGEIMNVDKRILKDGARVRYKIDLSDYTDSIYAMIFSSVEEAEELDKSLTAGTCVRLSANVRIDEYSKDRELMLTNVKGICKIDGIREKRADHSPEKRVELHCHTKMSDMDATSSAKDIIKQAMAFGHKAIAITDHGGVQAFPEAFHTAEGADDFKVIYGVEAYLVDDEKVIVTNVRDDKQRIDEVPFVVFDLETTGFSAAKNRIIEIGAVKIEDGQITDRFSEFVNPKTPIPLRITELTSITDAMVQDAAGIEEVLPKFAAFCEGCVLAAHNADFDMSFIRKNAGDLSLSFSETYLDTVPLSAFLQPHLKNYKLDTVAAAYGVTNAHHHRAVDDAECTAEFFVKEVKQLAEMQIETFALLNKAHKPSDKMLKKSHADHIIILAKNDIGRINLYRLVSASHLNYAHTIGSKMTPKLPRSLIRKYREGLLLGSACSEGELYDAVMRGLPREQIVKIASFYDYLEVQPIGNNAYLVREDKYPVASDEELREINRRIVELGKDLKKPVVATCDVHFLNPEDEVYRRIIQAARGFDDCDMQPPLFLRTTEEMLEEFSYLGTETAEEIVIKNTNKIAAMCERIKPTRPDKCPPVIENSDETLRKICYTKAHEVYGDDLPPIVEERLERELNSIISNGYAVMYIIAQKLVWKSNEDGYLVGSRGSVGSSFVATMAGITEVNPLSPHYICPKCHYTDFDSEEVKAFAGRAGCDMPDKDCPHCGTKLKKEGFDIPFETFLGFKGDKEPDIDLNFSGDYQAKAHRYTEVIFGEGQTFKAGTVSGVAEKTAFAYVRKYFSERDKRKRKTEIERLSKGCVDVRKTTGQHPGGIIVLPMGEEINTFTPVQHPPQDDSIITTHFDYHSIDSNLLKLDILGHDDPTMIRMLEDLTGIDAKTIPLDDPSVMSLFKNTDALGITPDDIFRCRMGTLGVPEFGTDFAMEMLRDTKPTEFSDLVRIAGLAHGTDVWLGNAEKLIKEGKATISTAICTRDDIMTYLIGKGLDPARAFSIMENVRKGKVAKGKCGDWDEWKEDMLSHDVPDWYVWSCEHIQYMFPKAHAAAYVMMAWRVAYCKVFYPLEYYTAYYSVRADGFDYAQMCFGKAKLQPIMTEYYRRLDSKEKSEELSGTEKNILRDMRIVDEMYARGFEFMPIDLYGAEPRNFKIIDGKIMPALNSIPGLGEQAAETLAVAAREAKFLSLDDMRERGKITKANVETMKELGLCEGLPESNQMSIFDFA